MTTDQALALIVAVTQATDAIRWLTVIVFLGLWSVGYNIRKARKP